MALTKSIGCYIQQTDAVLYKTVLWKIQLSDVEIESFSKSVDKFLGIAPNAPIMIGTM